MKNTVLLLLCTLCTISLSTQLGIAIGMPVHFAINVSAAGDYEEYIKQAQQEISENDKRIAALLVKLVGDKNTDREKLPREVKRLVKSILVLQVYNEELRKDMENYISYGTGDWQLFKKEFDRELAEIGKNLNEVRLQVYEYFIA